MKKILVIGAGMSGLTAARILDKKRFEVTVLDKGGGFGGRMSTRRLGEARIDYGAQYFSAKTTEFQAFVDEALKAGALRKWMPAHKMDGHPRYVGSDGMTRFPKFLADGLNVKRRTRVVHISENEKGWEVTTEAGDTYEAEAIIATMPSPQAIDLLEKSELHLEQTNAELNRIEYAPCLAVLARLNEAVALNSIVPNKAEPDHPIAWIANNQSKGITDEPSVTIHPTTDFSREHLDGDLEKAGEILLEKAASFLAPAEVTEWQIHRWRYSQSIVRHPDKFWKAETRYPLLFGGDGFGVGNVEGAFLSGYAMAYSMSNE